MRVLYYAHSLRDTQRNRKVERWRTMTKFKKKAFKTGKTYYIRIQVKTKKNITCGNYYQGYVYFYRTLRF